MEKYITESASGKWSVRFSKKIKNPRRLGAYDTLVLAIAARDKYLASVGEMALEQAEVNQSIKSKTIVGAQSVVFLADLHCPYQDDVAIDLACKILNRVQPDLVVFGGDVIDFYHISTFVSDPKRRDTTQDEIDIWKKVARKIMAATGKSRFIMIGGNHEARLYRHLCSNPGLFSLDALRLPSLLGLNELGIEYVDADLELFNQKLVLKHGRYYSSIAGSAVKKEVGTRAWQQSVIQGHEHKLGYYRVNGPLWSVGGWSVGCLCVLDCWYSTEPQYWEQGLAVIASQGDFFNVENIRFDGDKVIFRGECINGNI